MKKFLLLFAVAATVLSACTDYTDDFNAINGRLDALEQSLPSIEQQISVIKTQITSLKETDSAIKEEIADLEKSDKATATEISELKAKDSALEKAINDLQSYIDGEIQKAKSEAAAAYATIEQYNALVALLDEVRQATDKLGEQLTAKIDAEVKSLNDKIADLEARLAAVEESVAKLLARIQSVSYVPEYSDGKAGITRIGGHSEVELSFKISPKECAAELAKVWESAVSCEAVYTKSRAATLVAMPAQEFVADAESGIITVIASGENLSDEFFAGTQEASVALVISDGNSSVTSEYIPMVAKEVIDEIWYTTTDGNPLTPQNIGVEIFGANLLSNTYNEESGYFVLKFDGPVTKVGEKAFGTSKANTDTLDTTLKEVILPQGVTSIESWAFAWCCDNLVSISMPNSVTSIGRTAFGGCTNLETVKMSENVTTFGDYVFCFCSSLKDIELPKALTVIPLETFDSCESLTHIDIPDSVTSIGKGAFKNCTGLASVTILGNVTTIDYHAFFCCSKLADITIPATTTTIGTGAFQNCSSLTSVTIPDSVTDIEGYAFHSCTNLTDLTIGNSVTSIGYRAFYNCSSLTSVTIPNSVTSIGESAFQNCSSLTSVTIPNSVTSIGTSAFANCSALKRVDITDLSAWCRIDFANYTSTPVAQARCLHLNGVEITDLVIPADVTEIKQYAFYNNDAITNVVLHNGITSIGYESFACCGSYGTFTSITIPESVSSIAAGAFHMTNSLSAFYGKFATEDNRAIVINNELIAVAPAGLTSYRVPDGVTHIGNTLFRKISLKTITVPSSVTSIGGRAFAALENDDIVIFEGVTPPTLESSAFKDIKGAIFVPAEAVDTYKSAWASLAGYIKPYEEGLNVITYTSTDGNIVSPYSGERNEFRTIESLFNAKMISNTYENGVGKMVFDGVVSIIGDSAFCNCKTLKSISLPSGVVALGGDAFYECRNLADVTLNNGLKTIYGGAFHFCDALKTLTIPDSVNDIRETAFFNCGLDYIYSKNSTADNMSLIEDNNLHWVAQSYPAGDYIIPDGVVKIANYAFNYPKNVISITLPESIETFSSHPFIGVYNISAFYGKYTTDDHRAVIKDNKLYAVAANGITEYVVPDGVKEIAYRMLRACRLTTITLPASLEKVGGNQFEDATKLKYVYCKAVVPPTSNDQLFLRASKVEKIYVPRNSVEAYKVATGWSLHADKIVGYDF